MDRLIIRGGNPLVGIVHVSGGKKRRAAAKITAGWESLSPLKFLDNNSAVGRYADLRRSYRPTV
jgi:hypothetical protein